MKQLLSFAFLVCFFSCADNRYARTIFNQTESLMSAAPDSALALVRGIDGKILLTKDLRARHALLLTMAQDKCYIDVEKDSIIRIAYDYFQHQSDNPNRLLATYYLGVIRQNAGEYINAALAFREAEPLAEELGNYRQLSLIDQHLSRIFADNLDHVRAREYSEKALNAAELAGDRLMADYCRYDIAEQLLAEYQYEEAETILNQILQSNEKNSPIYSLAAKQMAHVSLFKSETDYYRAKEYYQEVSSLGILKMTSEDYGRMALINQMEGKIDKADSCLSYSLNNAKTRVDSLVYYNYSYNIFERRGDWRNASKSLYVTRTLQDDIVMGTLGQSLTHAMEDYYLEVLEKERIQTRFRFLVFGFVGIVLLVLISFLSLLLRRKNRQLLEDMARIQDISTELVDTLVADKVRSLQQLSESYFSWEDSAVKKREKKNGWQSKDEVIASFRTQLSELRNDKDFISTLEHSLNLSEDGIFDKAREALKIEKNLDSSILTLIFSGFSIKSISYLLRMSEASLRMRKTRIKQQFEAMPEPNRSLFLTKLGL